MLPGFPLPMPRATAITHTSTRGSPHVTTPTPPIALTWNQMRGLMHDRDGGTIRAYSMCIVSTRVPCPAQKFSLHFCATQGRLAALANIEPATPTACNSNHLPR